MILEIDHVLGQTLKDEDTLFFILRLRDKNDVTKIDLPECQLVSTTELKPGEDVK